MQIILVQAEVEQAIKDYIANRVTLAEGSDIVIDLKAGRGPEGFTANIDIVPSVSDIVPSVGKSDTPTVPVKRASVPKAAEATEKAAEPVTATVMADEDPNDAQEASSGEEVSSDTKADAETASDEETPATPAKSLFANLKKPQNG